MRQKHLFILIVIISVLTQYQANAQKTIGQPSVHLKIPKGFTKMTQEEWQRKESSITPPLLSYTNPQRSCDIIVKVLDSQFQSSDLDIMGQFYKSNLLTLYDNVKWIEDKTVKVKGKNFKSFTFISTLKPPKNNINIRTIKKQYTIIYTTIFKTKKYNIIFTFSEAEKETYIPIGKKLMNSIKIY